jgi:SnoaL-like domain
MDDDHLADRVGLQELKASYFRYLDTKQWDSWRELFTDDMVFYADSASVPTEPQPMTTSGDDFVEMVSSTLADAVTVHQGHMPELRFVDERTANGIWAMYDWVDRSGSGGDSMQGFGHYHEHYVKGDDGKWRIKELRLTRLRTDRTAISALAPLQVTPWKEQAATSPKIGAGIVAPINRVNLALPFSKITIREASEEFAELSAIVVELLAALENDSSGQAITALRQRAQALAAG